MDKNIIYGLSDIYIADEKVGLQAESSKVNIEPLYKDITINEILYDRRISGYQGSVEFVVAEDDLKYYEYALASKILEKDDKKALTDLKIGTSLREEKSKKIIVHPCGYGTTKDYDINIFKAIPGGTFSREYGHEQGKLAIKFDLIIKDDADFDSDGNYYLIGDPAILEP